MGKRRSYRATADSDEEVDLSLALDDVEDRISVLRKGRPPPPYTLEDFRDKFGLSAEGINPHKSKDTVGILQTDLVAVFGPQRGKSGFFFGDCKNADIRNEINRIYSIVYQHPHGPRNKLIGKDFTIGIVADVVKKLDVSWAAFTSQSNNNQRNAWTKKMTTALQEKAKLVEKSFEEVAEEEGFDEMLQGLHMVKNEVLAAASRHNTPAMVVGGRLGEPCGFISDKKTEISELLVVVRLELQCIKKDVGEAMKERDVICRLVDSMRMALWSMEQTCEECRSKMEAEREGAEKVNLKMTYDFYRSTLMKQEAEFAKISAEEKVKVNIHQSLLKRTEFLESQLASLTPQLHSLHRGQSGFALHPHPITSSISSGLNDDGVIHVTNCVVCDMPFPLSDIVVCSCKHLYHPWCAVTWFKGAWKCKEQSCNTTVHPNWYKSFGFVEPHAALAEKAEELDCEVLRQQVICERTTIAKGKLPDIGSSQPLPSGPGSICTGVWSHGEASQAVNPQFKLRISDSTRSKIKDAEDDSAMNTPDSDRVKKDAPETLGQADSPLHGLVPRALDADRELGSGDNDSPTPNTTIVEDASDCHLPDLGAEIEDVEMEPIPAEENVADDEGDAALSGGLECRQAKIQGDGSGLKVAENLGESDRDRVLEELRAEIAALKGQTPDSSAPIEKIQSPSTSEPSQKGVVRNVPPFEVWQPNTAGPVKTRSVAELAVPPAASTRANSKTEKVRTRGDGPATSVPPQKNRKQPQKRPKVDLLKP